jgi:hypothetical protein
MRLGVAAASVHRLANGDVDDHAILEWGCPVPYFGHLGKARVATLGINPSNREFVDSSGQELDGTARRFPTLGSLGLHRWGEASSLDVAGIVDACDGYFDGNPYDRWFRVLDAVVQSAGASYYRAEAAAAHLDLVPYATKDKWGDLGPDSQRSLLDSGGDLLAALLRDSEVELLVLNGRSVVRQFEAVAEITLSEERHSAWDLTRQGGAKPVPGFGYTGIVTSLGGIDLGRTVSIAGFNHNLQSSFGVTRRALDAIAAWVGSRR